MRSALGSLLLVFCLAEVSVAQSSLRVHRDTDGKVTRVHLGGKSSSDRLTTTLGSISAIAKLKSVQSVTLSFATVDDAMIQPLLGMQDLVYLDLRFSDVTGESIAMLAELPKLRILLLDNCDVRDDHLVALAKMPQLNGLSLERTKVTSRGLKHIGQLKELVDLNLQACDIDDVGLASMGHFPQIRSLFLTKSMRYGRDDRVDLTDKSIDYLASLSTLTDLRIGSTKITDVGIAKLKLALPQARIDTAESGILQIGGKRPDATAKH
ncbi:MAG: hypothetical protein WBD20_21490 [Pirellulaceae bacterium]